MLLFLLLAVGVSHVAAQDGFMCECGLILQDQLDLGQTPIPLAYLGRDNVDNGTCNEDININTCSLTCQILFDERTDDLQLCEPDKALTRCYGSVWCEILNTRNWGNVANGDINLFYRVSECGEEHPMADYNFAGRSVEDPICCNNGRFQPCDEPCEPSCFEDHLCECAVFVDGQFEAVPEGTTPSTFLNLGFEMGADEDYCDGWPDDDNNHICDEKCDSLVGDWLEKFTLDDPWPNNEAMTYGEAMCYGLYGRWADDWPDNGIQYRQLRAHGRMPGCDPFWNPWVYGIHEENLCCDATGGHYTCD